MTEQPQPPTLYIVATPIGNLEDITLRALRVLREVDVVASEDTRTTGFLLKHFEIKKPQMSFHEHNERHAGEKIISMIQAGQSVAIVSDAGTPGVSDPGFTIVRRAIEENINVTMIPGPTALVMAVVLSGLPVHSFTFRGFPPRKGGPRRRFIAVDKDAPHTLVFYESPYRLVAFLRDALDQLGDRDAALGNDLTKFYEAVQRGTLSELIAALDGTKLKGEYTVVIAGASKPTRTSAQDEDEDDDADEEE